MVANNGKKEQICRTGYFIAAIDVPVLPLLAVTASSHYSLLSLCTIDPWVQKEDGRRRSV